MYMIIWEYLVAEGKEAEFEPIYGSDGDWRQLFRRSKGYLGTELLRDSSNPRRYITIDRWESAAAFETFLEEYRAEYEAMDARCERLTEHEQQIAEGDLIFST